MTRVWLARGKVGAWCRETVQRCKAAYGLWKGGKVNTKIGRGVAGQITEYGVQITEEK